MEMCVPTMKRSVTIEMDASFEHFNAMMEIMEQHKWFSKWKVTTALSCPPKVGEQWRMGNGKIVTITGVDIRRPYPITGTEGKSCGPLFSWTLDGVHYEGIHMDCMNLVERVYVQANVGEYWMLDNGEVELIKEVDLTQKYCIISKTRSWTSQGIYNTNNLQSGLNLKCQVNITPTGKEC